VFPFCAIFVGYKREMNMETKYLTTAIANYATVEITVAGNTYSVMQVTGKLNYINICKKTNNPGLTTGKHFPNMDAAIANYTSMAMKAALMQIRF
jgi:hypothetical protein